MSDSAFDERTLHGASRRRSLLTLGGAALAAVVATPANVAAKKGRKGMERCRKQQPQCRAAIEEYCAPQSNQQPCLTNLSLCCDRFTSCNVGAAITCVYDTLLLLSQP